MKEGMITGLTQHLKKFRRLDGLEQEIYSSLTVVMAPWLLFFPFQIVIGIGID